MPDFERMMNDAVDFITSELIGNEYGSSTGGAAYPASIKGEIAKRLIHMPYGWPDEEEALVWLEESFNWAS